MMTKEEALRQMTSYCSMAERCKSDIVDKLKKKDTSEEAIQEVVAYLEKENYISEERFCRAFVNDKFRFSKWGKLKIRQALSLKRLPSAAIYDALDAIEEKLYLDTLRELIEAKRKSVKAKNDYELNGKLIRFALGRGFEMHDINRCLKGCNAFDEEF